MNERAHTFKLGSKYRRPLTYALIIALLLGAWLLRSYFSLIISATIVAYVFSPVYSWLQKRTKRDSSAAALTLLITLVAIIVPLTLILALTIAQASTLVNDIGDIVQQKNFDQASQEVLNWVNTTLSNMTGRTITITMDQVWEYAAQYVSAFASYIVDLLQSWVGGIGSIITGIILYMYVFTGILVNQEKIASTFERLNPLGKDVSRLYVHRAAAMTTGMVRGQFIIAIIQGFISAGVLYLVGLGYFPFFFLILSFLSVIPLGAGIVTIPIGILMILLGDYLGGIIVLLNHFVIVTNVDNVLKPKLVPKSVRLHPALILLAVFAGIGIFGFLGIIIGPVLMILIITTIEVYLASVQPLETEAELSKT